MCVGCFRALGLRGFRNLETEEGFGVQSRLGFRILSAKSLVSSGFFIFS